MRARRIIREVSLLLAACCIGASFCAGPTPAAADESAETSEDARGSGDPATPHESWTDWEGASGDWGGLRTQLGERGVDLFAQYTTGFWANTVGGFDTGARYEGFAMWGFGIDLEHLVGWRGGSFRMNWNSYHGGQPSTELVGLFATEALSGWEASTSIRFFEIAFSQRLFGDRVRFEIGQLTSDGEFFQSRTSALLLNATFGFLGFERQLTPFYPLAAPGVFLGLRTRDAAWEIRGAVYTANAGQDVRSNIGFDWSIDDEVSFFTEVFARPKIGGARPEFSIGIVGADAAAIEGATNVDLGSRISLYGVADWPVIAPADDRPGLSLFFRGFGTPSSGIVLTEWYVSGGFALHQPLPGRADDAFGFGFTHQVFDDQYVALERSAGNAVSPSESVLEFTYRAQVFRWLVVQPDLQIAIDPHFSRRNALAVGLRGVIGF